MISSSDVARLREATAYSRDGSKLGSVGEVYLDDETGRPEWVTVTTGLFGSSQSFVPLERAELDGDDLVVPYDKAKVKDAPRLGDDGHLSPEEERQLYAYYGLGGADVTSSTERTGGTGRSGGTTGYDTSGPTTDDAMTRSEEQLNVGTEQREAGRVRLRKYVTTETETVQVPVTKEEVRLEREPITDANRGDALAGPTISEEEHEVVLHEERPVVTKDAVPVERVRLEKEAHVETETVSEEVRKEQIETDEGRH
jgi:uncharacterized protein (TIGR02271 family)